MTMESVGPDNPQIEAELRDEIDVVLPSDELYLQALQKEQEYIDQCTQRAEAAHTFIGYTLHRMRAMRARPSSVASPLVDESTELKRVVEEAEIIVIEDYRRKTKGK